MQLPYISADEVHAALPYDVLVEGLRQAFREGCEAPLRHVHQIGETGDRLLLMPAWRAGREMGVKLVSVFPGNRERGLATVAALYVLLDGSSGHPLALIDGEALTLRRTAAASALASTYLSRADSSTLLVVGTGALAPHMAEAHCSVRPIRKVLVWGRQASRAAALAASLRQAGLAAEAVADLEQALAAADIVTCATTAVAPVIHGRLARPGMHFDLVGAFTPQMRECDDALLARAGVFVDTYPGALKEAGELVQSIASGAFARDDVRADLAELVNGSRPGRNSDEQITLFKSVGSALEDLCAARLVQQRTATAHGPRHA